MGRARSLGEPKDFLALPLVAPVDDANDGAVDVNCDAPEAKCEPHDEETRTFGRVEAEEEGASHGRDGTL